VHKDAEPTVLLVEDNEVNQAVAVGMLPTSSSPCSSGTSNVPRPGEHARRDDRARRRGGRSAMSSSAPAHGSHRDSATFGSDMSVVAPSPPTPTRRQRAAKTVAAALRGGLAGAIAATVAWLAAGAIAGTAFVLLVVATLGVAAVVVWKGDVKTWVWLALGIAWAIVLLERAIVQENGGVWVAIAAWLGVIDGARRAGISKWALPLLAYPALSLAIVLMAGEDLLDPWGVSWLWVAAVVGPVLGARTLLSPRPEQTARSPSAL
jgi:hypothetical protein